MAITEFLQKILNARYGKDVRQSIHDAIEACYNDATGNPESIAGAVRDIERFKDQTITNIERIVAEEVQGKMAFPDYANSSSMYTLPEYTFSNTEEKSYVTTVSQDGYICLYLGDSPITGQTGSGEPLLHFDMFINGKYLDSIASTGAFGNDIAFDKQRSDIFPVKTGDVIQLSAVGRSIKITGVCVEFFPMR